MALALYRRGLIRRHNGLLEIVSRATAGSSTAVPFCTSQRRGITLAQLDSSKGNRERVVILGSGWAGYTVARSLDARKYQPVIVSPRSYFVFTPLLASTSVGTLEFRTALEPVRSRRTRSIAFFQGWADAVDFNKRRVAVEEAVDDPQQAVAPTTGRHEGESEDVRRKERERGRKKGRVFDLRYEKMVLAVGCYSQTFGIPGVREHALFLKDVGDARRIRNRLLACFETAALPTTSDEMRKHLLNFAVVGGGPTGIEFSAELHDLITEDMSKLYPELMPHFKITVYDVAPKVLSMFDAKLGQYAMETFKREGIAIKTSHHVQSLRRGLPKSSRVDPAIHDADTCWTLTVAEEGEVGVGMVVWSTGLMANPFVQEALSKPHSLPDSGITFDRRQVPNAGELSWVVKKHPRSGAIVTNDRLRLLLEPESWKEGEEKPVAVMKDVFALGDCATITNTALPATAQVASQQARWLAARLNKGDIDAQPFTYRNLGVMAYLGNWNAIMQSGGGGNVSGRAAWLVWRGAYLTKSVSWRNKLLIPVYWFVNWLFGRDISRF